MSTVDRPTRPRPSATHRPAGPPAGPARIFRPPDWEWAHHGEVGWWVRPDWRDRLLTPDGRLRLDEWGRDGRVEVVKDGPHRVVRRVDLPGGAVFVKHFLVPSWREVLRQWFRRGKGRNEAKRALRVAALGVPTIVPVALGERRRKKFLYDNFLVTPEIAGTVPLDRFVVDELPALEPRRAAVLRCRLAESLGALTARLHAAGVVHEDFHPGNLLLRLEADDRPRLALIDLDAVRVRDRITPAHAAANLAKLNHASLLLCTRTDRRRFLKSYVEASESRFGDARALARRVDGLTRRWAERLWRRRARRCTGRDGEFPLLRGPGRWAVASGSLAPATARALLADPDAPFRLPGTTIIKESRTTTVAELSLPVDGARTPVIYKRFNRKKRLEALWTLVRPSRAWRAWRANHHLRSRGLPTPPDLLVLGVDDRNGPVRVPPGPTVTYLLTKKSEPSITLGDHVREVLPRLDPAARRRALRRLTVALGRLVRDLHDRRLSDRDLKASNILIEGDLDAEAPTLSLIDLVGVRLVSPMPEHRRLQNLARLTASLAELPGWSRTETLRFLLAYLPGPRSAAGRWKAVYRAVDRRVRRKQDRNRRRGRPLS